MITIIIITALICWGFYNATRVVWSPIEQKYTKKEVLWFIKWHGDQLLPYWITKPLYNCPACMGSFWSIVTCAYFGLDVLTDILFIIPAVSGLNYIIGRLFPYSED